MRVYFALFIPAIEGGYSIFFPDFPIIATQGETLEECLFMSADALKLTVEAMAADREDLPAPCGYDAALAALQERMQAGEGVDHNRRPLIQLVQAPSIDETLVKISISMPRYALEAIDRAAKAHGMTRSGFLVKAAQSFA